MTDTYKLILGIFFAALFISGCDKPASGPTTQPTSEHEKAMHSIEEARQRGAIAGEKAKSQMERSLRILKLEGKSGSGSASPAEIIELDKLRRAAARDDEADRKAAEDQRLKKLVREAIREERDARKD